MTPKNLRLLAECLEMNFMLTEDRMKWARDLRAHARAVEASVLTLPESLPREATTAGSGKVSPEELERAFRDFDRMRLAEEAFYEDIGLLTVMGQHTREDPKVSAGCETGIKLGLLIAGYRTRRCVKCRGTGRGMVKHGMTYITDSDDEHALAYHDEPCPVCKGVGRV